MRECLIVDFGQSASALWRGPAAARFGWELAHSPAVLTYLKVRAVSGAIKIAP
jgi:hypothetical protein